MQWFRRLRWPWSKPKPGSLPARTADALRRLYMDHRRQRRLWAYSVCSALVLAALFAAFNVFIVFIEANLWVVLVPSVAIIFAAMQMRKCKSIGRLLRQAMTVQHQVEQIRAEAEAQRLSEEGEGSESPGGQNGESQSGRGPAEGNGRGSAGSAN